jgi:hypothetical protein
MTMTEYQHPAAADDDAGTDGIARRALGVAGLVLPIVAALAFALPWQVRFPVVVVGLLFGPGVPLMLLLSRLPIGQSVVVGLGLDVALILLTGEAMVLAQIWRPTYMIGALLVLSAIASVRLLMTLSVSRPTRGRHGNT